MLNLSIAMFQVWFASLLFLLQIENPVSISAPVDGETLKDVVAIMGNTTVDGYERHEMTFASVGDQTGTWFWLDSSNEMVSQSQLTLWDTKGITDGDYDLRLQVFLKDDSVLEVIVRDLKVRNYSESQPHNPVIDASPLSPLPGSLMPTSTEILTPDGSVTLAFASPAWGMVTQPKNPAALTESTIYSVLRIAGIITLVVIALLGFMLYMRRS